MAKQIQKATKLSGSQMIIEALHNEGVEVIFGYPGGAVLYIYDEIYKQNYFKHILVRHEQAALHAADGYARASGKVGVALVTSGPGMTNAITGIATAFTDSIPLVVLSGQVNISLIGTDSFQEIDSVGLSRPCTKHNFLVRTIEELPRILKEAFYIATSGRPGPVLVDIPKNVSKEIGDFIYPNEINLRTYKPTYKGNNRQISKLKDALSQAKKPLLYIGGGAVLSNSYDEIKQLAKLTNLPSVLTLMALGVIETNDKNCLGMVGMHGSYAANMAMQECDLLISLGARFDDRVTSNLAKFAPHAKIAHVDVDPSSIGKLVDVNYPIVGDLKNVVTQLIEILKEAKIDPKKWNPWTEKCNENKKSKPFAYKDSDKTLKPQWVIEETSKLIPKDSIITTDVGQHQMWVAQFYPFQAPRHFLTSGGLGTMGYGLPAAMGAKMADPKKMVVNFSGDGSILMNIQELLTCVESKIGVINIVLNNNYLGMVRQWQTYFYEKRYSHTDLSIQPDFIALSKAFGGTGYKVKTKEEFKKALKQSMEDAKKGIVSIIEVLIDRDENVIPMVASGCALDEMIME